MYKSSLGSIVVHCLALSPHSRKVLGLNPGQGISARSLHVLFVSAWVSSHIPKTCRVGRLIGDSKLLVGVSVDVFLALYGSPAMN